MLILGHTQCMLCGWFFSYSATFLRYLREYRHKNNKCPNVSWKIWRGFKQTLGFVNIQTEKRDKIRMVAYLYLYFSYFFFIKHFFCEKSGVFVILAAQELKSLIFLNTPRNHNVRPFSSSPPPLPDPPHLHIHRAHVRQRSTHEFMSSGCNLMAFKVKWLKPLRRL